MKEKKYEYIEGEVIRTTDDAVLLAIPSLDDIWVPRSLIQDGDEIKFGDVGMRIVEWFCDKNSL